MLSLPLLQQMWLADLEALDLVSDDSLVLLLMFTRSQLHLVRGNCFATKSLQQ